MLESVWEKGNSGLNKEDHEESLEGDEDRDVQSGIFCQILIPRGLEVNVLPESKSWAPQAAPSMPFSVGRRAAIHSYINAFSMLSASLPRPTSWFPKVAWPTIFIFF